MNTKTKAWVNMGLFLLTLLINTLGAYGFINGSSKRKSRTHTRRSSRQALLPSASGQHRAQMSTEPGYFCKVY